MGKKKQPESADAYATEAEVTDALKSLSSAELARLEKFAGLRAWALAGLGLNVEGDDLLNEAVKRTLGGSRRWSKRVNLVEHLLGAIRSISSHSAKKLQGVTLVSTNPPSPESEDDEATPWWELDSRMPDPERVALARIELERLGAAFASNDTILLIIDGLETGMTGPEIQKDLQISATTYNSAVTQMRRVARRKAG